MSDVSQGEGWWQASDGKWYAPVQAQAPVMTTSPAPAAAIARGPGATTPQGKGWYQAADGLYYPPQLSAKEQARLDKATRKAMRPWYKKKRWYFLAAILLTIILIVVVVSAAANKVVQQSTTVHVVTYSVTGRGAAQNITYDTLQEGNGQQGEAQDSNVPLPWSKTIHASGLITSYVVSATVGQSGGSVTCSITIDGKVVSKNTANGAFSTASCTGS